MRTICFVSDRTGVTAETMGHSLLSQFEGLQFRSVSTGATNRQPDLDLSWRLLWPKDDGKGHDALCRVDFLASYISRSGRAGHENGVRPFSKYRMTIRDMNVLYDSFGIEKNHKVMSKEPDGVDMQILLA